MFKTWLPVRPLEFDLRSQRQLPHSSDAISEVYYTRQLSVTIYWTLEYLSESRRVKILKSGLHFLAAGKAHINILYPGDVTIFPRGMLHFEINLGKKRADFLSALNSQNPGTLVRHSLPHHTLLVLIVDTRTVMGQGEEKVETKNIDFLDVLEADRLWSFRLTMNVRSISWPLRKSNEQLVRNVHKTSPSSSTRL